MNIIGHITRGCLDAIERLVSGSRLGERYGRFSSWIDDRRTRLAILSVLAD